MTLESAPFCSSVCFLLLLFSCRLHPLDAGRRRALVPLEFMRSLEWCQKKWKVIFLDAPHREQSHYRARQIQLVTEFAAQGRKRGQVRQDGERWGIIWAKLIGTEESRRLFADKKRNYKVKTFATPKRASGFAADRRCDLLDKVCIFYWVRD